MSQDDNLLRTFVEESADEHLADIGSSPQADASPPVATLSTIAAEGQPAHSTALDPPPSEETAMPDAPVFQLTERGEPSSPPPVDASNHASPGKPESSIRVSVGLLDQLMNLARGKAAGVEEYHVKLDRERLVAGVCRHLRATVAA